MKLPISVVVAISIIVIALVAILAFFITTGGRAASQAEMQSTFSRNCISICGRDDRATINLAAAYPEWQTACEQLYGVARGASAQCLERCQCGRLAAPCEFLCGFKDTVADWPSFCSEVTTRSSATYGRCDCRC